MRGIILQLLQCTDCGFEEAETLFWKRKKFDDTLSIQCTYRNWLVKDGGHGEYKQIKADFT
ncbi:MULTISPECIES: hypothetical protein [Brevibacillus]|uniref:hypothetical protein n=1 Tax=Brevibacillus TaxID=55080 RepID=UPI000E2FD8A8|nr:MULTISPECIES: hypothetical protein [Brevibacillus]MED1789197.1 hypothetical protein [Brevibacillus laterosporus]RFB34849.1 hypothetical protein DZB91_09925 [Brevibacillus sp. VP]